MRSKILISAILSLAIAGIGTASAQQKGPAEVMARELVETVATGCQKELATYCKDVTPGEGRVLACLYAHEDKLSARCEYALYDAAAQLERAISALTYMANECDRDLEKYCADVPAGKGRILECLKDNEQKLTSRCRQALEDTKLK